MRLHELEALQEESETEAAMAMLEKSQELQSALAGAGTAEEAASAAERPCEYGEWAVHRGELRNLQSGIWNLERRLLALVNQQFSIWFTIFFSCQVKILTCEISLKPNGLSDSRGGGGAT